MGIYKILAEGDRSVHAFRMIGGDISSDIRLAPSDDTQRNKVDFTHGEYPDFLWNIEYAGNDLYHVLLPDKDAVWTVGPEPHERILLKPNVGSKLQTFTFEYLPEN
ncbi:hypothetical protein P691DRAFT_789174 [Macrolepiota fuliginosa MF-IS2]|uniref:Uncharacterized protein n=1 Tax=Macrolepiota fuliginosa MF-IS2 TaxID=1400762 RepID=A0A9P6C6N1_9AGAR|nr:hypothetical protein P691DRAFT_789174 [Macrolepiota fuliginosa MF-IS2]